MSITSVWVVSMFLVSLIGNVSGFMNSITQQSRIMSFKKFEVKEDTILKPNFGSSIVSQRSKPLKDILGLGPAEIAISLVVGLVLFGPETLKSLSKDVGKAAAELKEIPKTFKEGMDEGAQNTEVSKMKEIAAEKRKKRDAKKQKAAEGGGDEGEEVEDEVDA
jgi:Sec-independent protein translocase protein TatA